MVHLGPIHLELSENDMGFLAEASTPSLIIFLTHLSIAALASAAILFCTRTCVSNSRLFGVCTCCFRECFLFLAMCFSFTKTRLAHAIKRNFSAEKNLIFFIFAQNIDHVSNSSRRF